MTTQFANEIGLLRTLARNLILKPSPSGPVTQDFLRDEGLACVRRHGDGLVAILRPGHEAFTDLSESVIGQFPAMERGMIFSHFETERRRPLSTSILRRGLQNWPPPHNLRSVRYFALVGPSPLDRAAVFIVIEEAAQSEFYPRGNPASGHSIA